MSHEEDRPPTSGAAPEIAAPGDPSTVRCPFCLSGDTEPLALFGSQLSTAQYYCRACHTPFEYIHRAPAPGD